MEIAGRIVLVTGANRGIGAAVVDALVAAGASKVYAAVRSVDAYRPRDPRIVPVALDVTDDARVAEVATELGDVEVLINNAGLSRGEPLLAASDAKAAEVEMRVNYFGTLSMCRAFAPVLARNGGGAIVNVLSIASRVSLPRIGSYSASKAAAFSLTQAIRAELAARGTLVVGVMPAFVDTDMARRVSAPKLTAGALAASIIDALRDDIEDVYPGDAANVALGLQSDPKAVEKRFASMFPAGSST